jgi:hypothetical protein
MNHLKMNHLKQQSWLSTDMAVAWLLAGLAVLLQMATNGRYGYFRDELYYLEEADGGSAAAL